MESKFMFLLFLVSVAYTAGQDSSVSSDSSDSSDSSNSSGSSGSGEDNDYSYPCSLDDLDCIRDYFAQSNMCTKVSHEDGEPVNNDKIVCYTPKFNTSYTCLDDVITFYGSKIEKFYVNKQSNNLIMTVRFDAINLYTPKTLVAIHLKGHEAKVVETHINVTYTVALTAVFPNAGLSGLAGASVSSYNIVAEPPFEFGPEVTDSSNEVVMKFWEALIEDIPTAVEELFLTKGPYLNFIYLQTYICNFGLEYTGEIF